MTLRAAQGKGPSVAPVVAGGGAPVGGSGTVNFIPLWTAASTLGNSVARQVGGLIGVGGAPIASALFQVLKDGVPQIYIVGADAGGANNPELDMLRSRGTLAAPTAVADGDRVGSIICAAYSGAIAGYGTGAAILTLVDGAVVADQSPGQRIQILTAAPNGATTVRMTFRATGNIEVSAPMVFGSGANVQDTPTALAIAAAAFTINADLANWYTITLTENVTANAPTNPRAGRKFLLAIRQDGVGTRTVTWDAAFRFPAATAPTLTATVDKTDYLTFAWNVTDSVWDMIDIQQDL